jgi:hypothetical protein
MRKKIQSILLVAAFGFSLLTVPSAQALPFERTPSTVWFHTYGTGVQTQKNPSSNIVAQPKSPVANVNTKSRFDITYIGFPADAQAAFQAAADIWSDYFQSAVPIKIQVTWGRQTSGVLGSTRPDYFYKNFAGAPAREINYPSALANAIAGKDLDVNRPDIIMTINARAPWYLGTDGRPGRSEYDLISVVLHEIPHGLGFLTLAAYDPFFGYGSIDQPTPFDAYSQLPDGRLLIDLPSPSLDLGKAMVNKLVWSGPLGVAANNGNKILLYTPSRFEVGSSVSHLDEATFSTSLTDAVMTPNLDVAEVFRTPGPIVLAMLEDMRGKPAPGIPTGIPEGPRNVKAIVGDKSAIVTFDPPGNARLSQVTSYVVQASNNSDPVTVLTSPAVITGLKNGTSYSFTVTAKNQLGISDPVTSNAVIPESTWRATTIDPNADGKFLAKVTYKGQPAIAYTDSKFGDIKLATYNGKKWNITIIDGNASTGGKTRNNLAGDLSLCVSGTGTSQKLHLFYSDMVNQDLRYAYFDGKKWSYEIVDGDGPSLNKYDDPNRTRTNSNVSVTNACVYTSAGLQVFYRDESQGVLLGAVRSGNSWIYEMVDGDKNTNDRTTGDVGFHLQALALDKKVYLLYDSILTINQSSEATTGEVRLATRSSIYNEDWKYTTLAATGGPIAVSGYNVALSTVGTRVFAAWYSASGITIPNPNRVVWATVSGTEASSTTSIDNFGTPLGALAIDDKDILVGCESRLCVLNKIDQSVDLVSTALFERETNILWITLGKVRYALTSVNGKLSLLK